MARKSYPWDGDTSGQCHGISKTTGERCKQRAKPGRDFCRYHGGNLPVGEDNPAYTVGRYSKFAPLEIKTNMEYLLGHPELTELRDDIVLVQARISHMLGELDADVAVEDLHKIIEAWEQFVMARAEDDYLPGPAVRQRLDILGNVIRTSGERRVNQLDSWDRLVELVDKKRRLIETEAKVIRDEGRFMSDDRVHALMYFILEVIKRNVPDATIRRQIADELNPVLH